MNNDEIDTGSGDSSSSNESNESQATNSDETINVAPRMVKENFSIQTSKDEKKDDK